MIADADYAYVTLRSNNNGCGGTLNQLNVYDIQGALVMTPKLVGSLLMPEPHGLGKKDNFVYVCMGNVGMNVVDVSDKTKPKIVKTITGEDFIDVIPYDDVLIAYVTGGMVLYDIANAANPQQKSAIKN